MDIDLSGKNIGFLMANGFTEDHYTQPMAALRKAGANVYIIGQESGTVMAWHDNAWGHSFMVDVAAPEANPEAFDMLLIPGGVEHVKVLTADEHCRTFVKELAQHNAVIGAMGTGTTMIAAAGLAGGRTFAADETTKEEIEKAGANVAEGGMAVDGRIVTLSDDDQLKDFIAATAELAAGREEQKNAA